MPSQIKWLGIIRSDLGMYQKENYLSKVLCAVRHKEKWHKATKPQSYAIFWRRRWDSNPRTGSSPIKRFRVFYSQHTLADFEKKCPILRENALVRRKMIFSPLRLFPTVRNVRELSERTNLNAIKHNSRKSP